MEDRYKENNSNKKKEEYEEKQIFSTQLDKIRFWQFCSNNFITFSTVSIFSTYKYSSGLCTKFAKDTSKRRRDPALCRIELFGCRNPVLDLSLRNISFAVIKEKSFAMEARTTAATECKVQATRFLCCSVGWPDCSAQFYFKY